MNKSLNYFRVKARQSFTDLAIEGVPRSPDNFYRGISTSTWTSPPALP